MELRNLRALVEIVRQGGFTRAARTLFSTQSTVSKAVKQLEEELGEALLERLGNGVRLTEAGEIVYARAAAMLAEGEHMVAELADLRGLISGRLRLGLPIFGSARLFAPLFAEYRSRHPGVEIELMEQGSARLEQALLAGEVELAVSLLPVPEAFDWQLVRDDPMMALLWSDHPLAGRKTARLAQFASAPMILFEQGFALNARIETACRARGFEPMTVARSGQVDFIIALVASGLGVALLPRILTEGRPLSPLTAVLVDETDLRWQAALVWRKGARLSPAARAWLALTREKLPPGGLSGEGPTA
ncbi:transcriptional regulator, LysR family [Solidesulfovibrio fructosivorans JJ]]|uniref:Transcriptional regulator, LysR family n=1 Tax=Solidesulfovibrio fructosivorans JJ] TaxID=596151 RepID=E1K2B6_SOLFR|nr:LysR family transcriptional regulator [Solidesulfovibrio fructosivorans]EFL49236.1 transcriptional regulator, LysR family [Solidesulfovibrio fructosivorans JJ]]